MEIKPKVCRNLFGSPTPEERVKWKNDVKEELAKDNLVAMKKWNFDMEKDVPLEGHYNWQVEIATNVPSFYTKGYAPTKCKIRREKCKRDIKNPGSDTDSDTEYSHSAKLPDLSEIERCENCEGDSMDDSGISSQNTSLLCNNSSESSVKITRKLKQTDINSFMRKRKRPSHTSQTVKRLRF